MPALTVTSRHELKVGSPDENFVSFEIAATEMLPMLFASIDIPCGKVTASQTYLCGDAQLARLHFLSDPADKLDGSVSRKDASVAWQSEDFSLDAGEQVTLRINGFNPESAGNAGIHLKIWFDPDAPLLHSQATTVSVSAAAGVAIIYFDVSPTNVLQGDPVTICSTSSGAKTVKLYAGDYAIAPAVPPVTNESGTVNRYTHTPQKATTYRLKIWQGKPGEDDAGDAQRHQFAQRETGVVVEPRPQWYSHDLLGKKFYPTLLLAAKDLSGKTAGDRLYGIFVNQETKQAGLWSSSSGFDDWRWEADVPEGMSESPGVIHKQALWLIGGSAADPLGRVSNRVCWYYRDQDRMVWKESSATAPPPRKCHTCAVFNDKVWVLGGLSEENNALDDVWTCSANPKTGDFTAPWESTGPLPSARCMSAVAATPESTKMRGVGKARLWLFGGATHPYNLDETFDELWWIEDGTNWQTLKLPGEKKGTPLAATLLYGGDGLLHLAGVFRGTGGDAQASEHGLLDAGLEPPSWRTGSLREFAWDYKTDLFLIRSVPFRERWMFWPVYPDMAEMGRHIPRIYNTP